tara:strand:- start:2072 stop:2944 length:873 start_codon:yes stop_codon:yes gene_type:complete
VKNKFILGSANFNQLYGIKSNFIKNIEIKKLLNFANKNKVKTIDTSPKYKNAENIIGSINKNRFNIISKIPKLPRKIKKKNIDKWIKHKANISLKNLKIKKFDCLMLNNSNSLLSKNGNEIYKSLRNIKKEGLTKKIGISIYDFKTLNKIIKKFQFNVVQAPMNIFDQRLIKTGFLKKLKKNKIEVHIRSIFLQGLLLLKYKQIPKKLKFLKKDWIEWENWLLNKKINPLKACVSFALSHKQIDGIVIGCDSKNQLKQILKEMKVKRKFSFYKFNKKNSALIDPRIWTAK